MKKKNSRFFRHFAILFAAAFAVHFFPGVSVPVKAADIEISLPGVVGGTLTFDESTGTITGCSPAVTSAEIPPEINGVTVLEVGANAFASCRQLTKISFSEGLFIVPFGAFSGCSSLELVSFPASLEFLDQWAFLNCSNLKTIEISPLNETYTVQDNILYSSPNPFAYIQKLFSSVPADETHRFARSRNKQSGSIKMRFHLVHTCQKSSFPTQFRKSGSPHFPAVQRCRN